MRLIRIISPVLVFSCFFFVSAKNNQAFAQKDKKSKEVKKPDWVMSRPVDKNYYQGIGVSMVNNYTQGHVEEAKKKAFNDIISEISVHVKSSSLMQQIEKNDELNSLFQSTTSVTAENDIAGYELVGSWGNESEYWVYYRLSKELFHRNKQRRLDRAKNIASQYYESGRADLKTGEIGKAYQNFVKGLVSLKEYLDDEITIVTDKGQEYLADALIYELIELNHAIQIVCDVNFIEVQLARPVNKNIGVQTTYLGRPIQLPIRPIFSVGSGEVPLSLITDQQGQASFQIQRVTGGENQQVMEVSIDVEGMSAEEKDANLIARLIRVKGDVPSCKVNIKAEKIKAFLSVDEDRFGKKLSQSSLSNAVKKNLAETSYEFLQSKDGAAVSVMISIASKKGEEHELKNLVLYTAYIDLYLTITNLSNGLQIYYKGVSQIKGSRSGSFDLALTEAEKLALDKFVQELLPEINNINLQ